MAFDIDESKVGTELGNVPIFHLDDLEEKLDEDVSVAILTVPSAEAQKVADRLVERGVKAILNFTPARLSVPKSVRVHHIDLSVELQSLIYFLKHYPL